MDAARRELASRSIHRGRPRAAYRMRNYFHLAFFFLFRFDLIFPAGPIFFPFPAGALACGVRGTSQHV